MSDPTLPAGRRRFIQLGSAMLGAGALPGWAAAQTPPALLPSEATRPRALQGLQFGDPSRGSVMAWSRSDRPARMVAEWSLDPRFAQATRIVGPSALAETDFTARQDLTGLPEGREVQLSQASVALRARVGTNTGIGSEALVADGSEAQKRRWLPRMASGELTGCLALTEPDAGSEASNVQTTARRDGRGDGADWILDGRKC